MDKKWYLSKSLWAQVVTYLAQILAWANMPELQNFMVQNPEFAMQVAVGIQAVVAAVFRLVTKQPLSV